MGALDRSRAMRLSGDCAPTILRLREGGILFLLEMGIAPSPLDAGHPSCAYFSWVKNENKYHVRKRPDFSPGHAIVFAMDEHERDIWRDGDGCYAALTLHDARFDGRFFVGVASTGIYCRPVCRVRTPKRANCSFYPTAAAAEAAGYRPCRRCRPELAPGLGGAGVGGNLAGLVAQRLEDVTGEVPDLERLAREYGTSSRHLRRLFQAHFGVSPRQYRQTSRLLAAKSLLTDTDLAITDVAYASGFSSLRAFHAAFRQQYGQAPASWRKERPVAERETITVSLGYRPPFDWQYLCAFFQARAIPGVEMVADAVYRRTVRVRKDGRTHTGWVEAADNPMENRLEIHLPSSLVTVLPRLLTALRYLFDLHAVPSRIAGVLAEPAAMLGLPAVPDIRLPGCVDGFEMAVRAILGQQVTVAGARTLIGRVAEKWGERIDTPWPELWCCFPESSVFVSCQGAVDDHLGPLGITGARARSIQTVAREIEAGRLRLVRGEDPALLRERLLAIGGIGAWTADYLLMRVLSWPDIFLEADAGVRKAIMQSQQPFPPEKVNLCRPWRSYLTLLLWRSLVREQEGVS